MIDPITAIVIGGVVYEVAMPHAPTPSADTPPSKAVYSGGGSSLVSQLMSGAAGGAGSTVTNAPVVPPMKRHGTLIDSGVHTPAMPAKIQQLNYGSPTLGEMGKQKLDELQANIKKQFDNMNEVGKQKAADTLNKELKLDPPLNGHEDWDTIAAVTGGAAGAAAGTALCGPICGKIGALAGAYLGVKLEEWLAKSWDDIQKWADDQWGKIEDAGKAVGNAAEDAYNAVTGWI